MNWSSSCVAVTDIERCVHDGGPGMAQVFWLMADG